MRKLIAAAATGAIAFSMAIPAFAAEETGTTSRMMMRPTSEQNLRAGPSRRSLQRTPVKLRKNQGEKRIMQDNPKASSANETCVAAAVAKREAALMAAMGVSDDAVTAAYTARASALATAWTATDATMRQTGIRAAWDAFKLSSKTARVAWMDASKAAWKTFTEEAKACGITTTGEEGAETVDAAM